MKDRKRGERRKRESREGKSDRCEKEGRHSRKKECWREGKDRRGRVKKGYVSFRCFVSVVYRV